MVRPLNLFEDNVGPRCVQACMLADASVYTSVFQSLKRTKPMLTYMSTPSVCQRMLPA